MEEILKAWWDFMDENSTASRYEYTEQEQRELIDSFLAKHPEFKRPE
jgi:hypothetical protein